MTVFLQILAVLLLVAGNAFFVAAEYALVTARRTRLMELAHDGNRRASMALRIMDDPVRFIGTVQLGITAFSIALGAFDTPTGTHLEMHIFVAEKGDYYEIGDDLLEAEPTVERDRLVIIGARHRHLVEAQPHPRVEPHALLAQRPDEPTLHFLLGDLYARQGLPREAMESFAEVGFLMSGPAARER